MSQIDIELAALLNSLSFGPQIMPAGAAPITIPLASCDAQMSDEGYQSDSTDTTSSSVAPPAPCPCALLQAFALCHGLGEGPQTVGDGELSQLVFTHREAFLVCPSAHAGCSAGLKGLASLLEKRVQVRGGSLGMDAVGMLRTEAWLLSGWSA
ncbi:hypothetical protein BJV78DRAFT_1232371 [Lactifluus subvellereus]|nr:hypothetical protein BJV78DRAFT_1232371 [Lactifluus subvellereus]